MRVQDLLPKLLDNKSIVLTQVRVKIRVLLGAFFSDDDDDDDDDVEFVSVALWIA